MSITTLELSRILQALGFIKVTFSGMFYTAKDELDWNIVSTDFQVLCATG